MKLAMSSAAQTLLLAFTALGLAACGFPRPPNVGDDVPGDSGIADPGTAIHVSMTGNDGNDGLTAPVKTLKQAIKLAAANTKITQIALAAGAYSMLSGEMFPYTLPPNVAVVGPSGGGAILLGTKSELGVSLTDGGLQDIDLQDFTTAISITGVASLKNIRVLTSSIAVQADKIANVTIDNLDITGTAGSCSKGIVLTAAAQATVTTFTARNVEPALDAKDQSSIDVTNANLQGTEACMISILEVASAGRFMIKDSVLDGGSSGIDLTPTSSAFQATISDTVVRNMKSGGLAGGFSGPPASIQWIGGEISSTSATAVQIDVSTWTFTGTKIQNNRDLAIYQQGGTLIMRGCTVTGNGVGIDAYLAAHTDLGTADRHGNNTFQGNKGQGVIAETAFAVSAVGNTWNPDVQGSDPAGRYPMTMTLNGPISAPDPSNYSIANGSILTR